MKKLLILPLLLITISAFAQNWKPAKLDSLVSVSMPADYKKKDTLNQTSFSGKTDFGFIIVNKSPEAIKAGTKIRNDKDLQAIYNSYITGIAQNAKSQPAKLRDTTIGSIKGKNFVFTVEGEEGPEVREFTVLLIGTDMYSFEFLQKQMHVTQAKETREAFFGSIKLADVKKQDQLTNAGEKLSAEEKSSEWKRYAMLGGIAGVIVVVIALIIRMRK
ncbi:MAG: hypothetical protein INR69_06230 [Mucilaginibacter polytrichastri]|nr:hypothetical protein [Mucilaginibacter polytrichastri]